MGLLRNLADRFDPPARAQLETRDADPSWAALTGGGSAWPVGRVAGAAISPKQAEGLVTCSSAVSLIAGSVASLPALVFRTSDGKRKIDDAHALARLIRNGPNAYQTWPDYLEWGLAQVILHGNSLTELIADRNGDVAELRPHPWQNVTCRQLANRRLVYDVTEYSALGGMGRTRRLLDDEVLHIRDRSDDGVIGRSRLMRSPSIMRLGLSAVTMEEFIYDNSGRKLTVLQLQQGVKISDASTTALRRDWESLYTGIANSGRTAIVPAGVEVKELQQSREDMEATASKRLIREEIASLFNIPLPLVGIWDHSSFTNSETAGRWFAQFTLAPWIRKIEEGFRRSVFSAATRDTHELHLDMSGFLRGDAETRWKAHEIAVKNRILTANEVRAEEGYDPRPELDETPTPLGTE